MKAQRLPTNQCHSSVQQIFLWHYQDVLKTMYTESRRNVHELLKEMPAHPRQQVMPNTKHKVQITEKFVESLQNPDFFCNATQIHAMTFDGVNNALNLR